MRLPLRFVRVGALGLVLSAILLSLPLVAQPSSGAVAPPFPPWPSEANAVMEFQLLNGVYSNPNPELDPVRQGPITVELRSPRNSLQLFRHRLALAPLGDGTFQAQLVADFEGEGDLEADVHLAGITRTLSDTVRLPRQTLVVAGRIRLERVENGFRAVALELPKEVTLAIDSQLGASLAVTCRGLTRFLPLVGCGSLEAALKKATIPLPEPGTELLLGDEQLTGEERALLQALLPYVSASPSKP